MLSTTLFLLPVAILYVWLTDISITEVRITDILLYQDSIVAHANIDKYCHTLSAMHF